MVKQSWKLTLNKASNQQLIKIRKKFLRGINRINIVLEERKKKDATNEDAEVGDKCGKSCDER